MVAAELLQRRIFLPAAIERKRATRRKRTASGSLVREGTVPGISASRASARACPVGTAGIEAIRPRV